MKKLVSLFVLAFCLIFNGCAMTRKLDAAMILKNTKINLKEVVLDSVEINPNLFEHAGKALQASLLPNPQVVSIVQNLARGIIESELGKANLSAKVIANSADQDTLWIRNLNATLSLDSLEALPLSLKDSCRLAPGENEISFTTQLPLDMRLFKLDMVKSYGIKGVLEVSLKQDGPSVPLEFDIVHEIKPEEMKALKEHVRENLLNVILADWVGAFFPEK